MILYSLLVIGNRVMTVQKLLYFVILINIVVPFASATTEKDRSCLSGTKCHGEQTFQKMLNDGTVISLYVDKNMLDNSIHNKQPCINCHTDITKIPHSENIQEVKCEYCHYEGNTLDAPYIGQVREYYESIHGRLHEHPEQIKLGKRAPYCRDCHGTHDIHKHDIPQSKTYKLNSPVTCGNCHEKEYSEYTESIHGQKLREGIMDSPSCTDCHGAHNIIPPNERESPVYSTHIVKTCSHCHESVEIVSKYGISPKRVSSYKNSFHGLANKYGVAAAANCSSCHGVHNILPSNDPDSSIHISNRLKTCGKTGCHPDATNAFVSGEIHSGAVNPRANIAFWVRITYAMLITATIGGMTIHNAFDFFRRRKTKKH